MEKYTLEEKIEYYQKKLFDLIAQMRSEKYRPIEYHNIISDLATAIGRLESLHKKYIDKKWEEIKKGPR